MNGNQQFAQWMSSKPTEVIAVILHHHVQAGHEEQVLHHGSGKPVLVIGNRESFVNINSMDYYMRARRSGGSGASMAGWLPALLCTGSATP